MQRAPILAVLSIVGAAVFAATRDEGFDLVGAGIIGGALAGGSVSLLSHSLVRTALQHDTQAAFQALTIGFGAKFLGAMLPWAALTFLPQAQHLADPTAYLLAYGSCVLLVLGAGVFDNLRLSTGDRDAPQVGMSSESSTANRPVRDGAGLDGRSEQSSSASPGSSPLESAS